MTELRHPTSREHDGPDWMRISYIQLYRLSQFECTDPNVLPGKSKYSYEALYLGGKILRSNALAGLSVLLGHPATTLHTYHLRKGCYHDYTGEIVMLRRLENTPGKAPATSPKRQRATAYSSGGAP